MASNKSLGWKPECPVLDADDEEIDEVLDEVQELQEQYHLGDAHVFQSSKNSYHIYFFYDSDRNRDQILEIIREASFVDEEFQEFQEDREKTRMRVKGKHDKEIKGLGVVESTYDGQGSEQRAEHLIRTFKRMKKVT